MTPRRDPWPLALARLVGFVALNAGFVYALARVLARTLPPLRGETDFVFVFPITAIAALVSVALHRVVLRCRSHGARALALWGAFNATLVLYGLFLGCADGYGNAASYALAHRHWYDFVRLVPLALLAGYGFGLLPLALLGALDKLTSPVLCPRPSSPSGALTRPAS